MTSITYEQFCGRSEESVAPVQISEVEISEHNLNDQETVQFAQLKYNSTRVTVMKTIKTHSNTYDGGIDKQVSANVSTSNNSGYSSAYVIGVWECKQLHKLQQLVDDAVNQGQSPNLVSKQIKIDIVKDILRWVDLPITRRGQCKDIYKFD